MSRDVYITGVGPVSALGLGKAANWDALCAGRSGIAPVRGFDASGMGSAVAGEVPEYKLRDFVPKHYRKATKVMARDIELAVIAADLAVRDAGLTTPGTDADGERTHAPQRTGCHIGAGLIAADADELTAALATSCDTGSSTHPDAQLPGVGGFDLHHWGAEGMQQLTPLWLLKYLPNMLACHVTILHDAQGPSNTITCGEASGGLSVGESLRVIQRGHADVCYCGGAVSPINPMAFYRQVLTGRFVGDPASEDPGGCVKPFDRNAAGGVIGEGGGIVVLESAETFGERDGEKRAYARLSGFAASQTVNRSDGNRTPDAEGRAIAAAIRNALREAGVAPEQVSFVVPFGLGDPAWDAAEAKALRSVFGNALDDTPVYTPKACVGNLHAGAGGYELAIAAVALHEQKLPPILNRDQPLDGFGATQPNHFGHALVFATSVGGQNTAAVLSRVEG